MIKNYFKIAWRNLVSNKVYSALNIIGLAAGMAVALLIALWVINEYSYDRFLPGYKQLYQAKVTFTSQHDGTNTQDAMSLPVAGVLKRDYPEIKYVAEADWGDQHVLMVGDKKLYMVGLATGSDFLKMFRFPLLSGNAATVLSDPYSVVLSQATAKALFGDSNPVGKMVRIDDEDNLKVTGIIKDLPKNSSFAFDFLFPFSYYDQTQSSVKDARTNWGNNSFQIFVMLRQGVNYATFAPKIRNLIYDKGAVMRPAKPVLSLQPMKDWHLYSDFKNGVAVGGFIDYVHMFSIIGALVLLIACINFMNLSTARSAKRAREVGVRKAIGSQRKDLIFQFLTESFLVTLFAFILAILMVQLVLPSFNALTNDFISIPYNSPVFWAIMAAYILITGLLAGSRPAFYLSSFNAVKVLKGGAAQSGRAAALPRKVLVVIQFTCSIALIISTIIVYQQIQYAKDRPTGYNTGRLVMSDMSSGLNAHYDALKTSLVQTGLVRNVAMASSPVTDIYSHTTIFNWPEKNASDETINTATVYVSDNYFNTVGMQLLQGRDFSSSWDLDTNCVIVNEAAVKRMGLKDPINQEISWNGDAGKVRIIGVVEDALMESPFKPVEPTLFSHFKRGNFTIYRLSVNANTHKAIEKIGKIFDQYDPAFPFVYHFADEEYDKKFSLEVLVGKLAGIFAGLAIAISCLGLFGLAAYTAEQRTKEIGIRKVLGASIIQVWVLLSSDFIFLVVISSVIASPVAFYFLHNWLQQYEYRISIGPEVFVLSAFAAVVITLITISFQSIKAALANPVKSLRSE